MTPMTAPADQGLAARALAEQTRRNLASAQREAEAADKARELAEQIRNGRQ